MYMVLVMLGRQVHTTELLISEPSSFKVDIAIGKLKRYESVLLMNNFVRFC
jgi:hypothetical protein